MTKKPSRAQLANISRFQLGGRQLPEFKSARTGEHVNAACVKYGWIEPCEAWPFYRATAAGIAALTAAPIRVSVTVNVELTAEQAADYGDRYVGTRDRAAVHAQMVTDIEGRLSQASYGASGQWTMNTAGKSIKIK